MNIEQCKEIYESLKKGKDFIANIDKDFFLNFAELLFNELDKKEAVINEMAGFIEVFELDNEIVKTYCDGTYENCKHKEDIGTCKSCIIEYFTNKVEREGK